MQPALSYNYAKKDFSRIKAIVKVVFFAGGFLSFVGGKIKCNHRKIK
ncbi:hypothetical protein LDL95_001069 [Campylobacter jejuni]|nr:hypothetical protein [Campylobacter jejuni]